MTNADRKARARAALSGNWGPAIGVMVLECILVSILNLISIPLFPEQYYAVGELTITFQPLTLEPLYILAGTALSVGVSGVFLKLVRGDRPRIEEMFDGFRLCFLAAAVAGVLTNLLTAVGLLLLAVPGILVMLGLSQIPYILRDQPDLNGVEAMKASWALMRGHKGELFLLMLSFFPWLLSCVLILPALYVGPYLQATMAVYHEELRGSL